LKNKLERYLNITIGLTIDLNTRTRHQIIN